ncbi:MAG: LacI family DNA-binding transcriptional regulator [Eubacteriales bacterium]|nr:LacI family DNA-binding transcriptional regulator [Eubacteriales bacterium]
MTGVSIKKIAEIAGVSRGTVDRALNDRYGIDSQLKARILQVAADLGYRSNRAGKMLSIRKSPLKIGVQMPSIGNDFFLEVVRGLNAAAQEYEDFGLTLSIQTMKGFDVDTQIAQIRDLLAQNINGLAFVPINHPAISALLDEIAARGIPVVTFNTDIAAGKRLCYVGTDYWHSGATAAGVLRLLAKNDPLKVLILTGSVQVLGHNQRITGFNQIIRQNCPAISIVDVLETLDDEDRSYTITAQALAIHPDLGAIYLTAGGVAGAGRAIAECQLQGKIIVISNDLTQTERDYLEQGVITATVDQQPYEQGYKPIQYLFDYLLDGRLPPEQTITHSEILIREHLINP